MKQEIQTKIEELLSKEFFCSPAELNGKEISYSIHPKADKPYIKILAYRNCVVVCTSETLHSKVQKLLRGKNRDKIFEFPFVYGQTIHYVPDTNFWGKLSVPSQYDCEFLSGKELSSLAGLTGFENSLTFDDNAASSAQAAYIARDGKRIISITSAAQSPVEGLQEIGIDVMEEYRTTGLGTFLVSKLTEELLAKSIIPFYSASVTNIGSQMVAGRCGYMPIWVDTFGTVLDGSSVYHDIISRLVI